MISTRAGWGASMVGLALAVSLFAGALLQPVLVGSADAHVTSKVSHLWKRHIKKMADRRYLNQRTSTHTVPFAAFGPLTSSQPYAMGGQFVSGQSGTGALFAPVTLPQRARITTVACHFYDVSPVSDVSCRFRWAPTGQPMVSSVAGNLVSSGNGGYQSVSTAAIDQPVVNNKRRVYYVQIAPVSSWDGLNAALVGVEITYTLE
ncbi:MAG TPA: hypothetical protein VF097_00170 [Actinomycetota bacterium]